MKRSSHTLTVAVVLALLAGPVALAQIQIKVNDTQWIKFGLLLQTQADAAQDTTTRAYAQNIFMRRARLLIGGQVAPKVTFFAETDAPNLGKSVTAGTKNSQPSVFIQDAYVEYKANDHFALDAGLMLVSPSRNGLQSAASLLPIDYGAHTFANSAPTQSSAGRDTGIQAKGYFHNKKFEYRAAVVQGMRDASNREFRTVARVQYNVFEAQEGYFYTGTYLGKKKILAFGAGIDHQHGYKGYAADAFFDYPVKGGAVTVQLDHIRYDGGSFLKSLPDQHDTLLEAGYLIGKTHWMPVIQFAKRNFATTAADETRYGFGVNYWVSGHNANIKVGYTRIDIDGVKGANQATVQFQLFYY